MLALTDHLFFLLVGAGAVVDLAPLIGTVAEPDPPGIEKGSLTGHLDQISEKKKQQLYLLKRWLKLMMAMDTESNLLATLT